LGTFGDLLPRGPMRAGGLFAHISAGLAILPLLAARLAWRLGDPPSPSEPTILGVWGD
jgi:cytochrome b561